jgi:glycosyltransferase involved in cell wall biosynthesis
VRDIAGIDVPVIVVPHPSYAGAYPNAPARDEARERLGLGPDEDVFLSFGNVRRYKGVDNLLNVAAASGPDVRFVIAGKATRFDPRLAAPSNCTILDGHIDDATVADLHAAADFAVLPLEEVTTSGSLMLALSFGLPVIAPRHSAIVDLVSDGREGSLYDPSLPGGLEDAIGRARQTPPWRRAAMRAAAAAAAAFHPPDAFATAIRHMLDELVQPSVAVADAAPVRKRRRTASARPRAPKVAATQGRSKRPWGRAAPRGDR